MPVRRLLSFIPSLAVMAVFLLCASGGWAADASGGISFPFLGGGEAGAANAVVTAFTYQWTFFGGMSGTGSTGGVTALYYMSITATLIGAILIVINKKYQDAMTIGTWFILVLVMVFAPYKSQLLFYPLGNNNGSNNSSSTVNDVSGFTPQVVAAHLGSVLSMLIFDVLRNGPGKSLSAQAAQQSAFQNDVNLKGDPVLGDQLKAYDDMCRKSGDRPPVLPANLNGQTANSTNGQTGTEPLANVYRRIDGNMQKGGSSGLPDSVAIPKYSAAPAEWQGTDNWAKYVKGVEALRAIYAPGTPAAVESTQTSNIPGVVDAIVQGMRANNTASEEMLRMGSIVTSADQGGSTIQDSDPTVTARKAYFIDRDGKSVTVWGQYNGQKNLGDARYMGELVKNNPTIAAMPVMSVSYKRANEAGSKQANYSTGTDADAFNGASQPSSATVKAQINVAPSCVGMADKLFTAAIASINPSQDSYEPLLTKLASSGAFKPTNGNTWTAEDLCSAKVQGAKCSETASNMANYLNAGNADARSFASTISNKIINNTGTGGASGVQQSGDGQALSTNANNARLNNGPAAGFKGFLSDTFATLGQAIVGALGYFIGGVMANAILAIIKVLAQAALMGVIIITPFVFLMGLLIPSNAAGMLITTTMAVFILKFYPATIAIIDYTIGAISSAVGASSSAFGSFTMTGILLLAEGYMAAKIISLTFFILFKMGDTNNLRALTNLEDAAGKIADVGVAATAAVAAVGGAALAGGIATAAPGVGGKMLGAAKGVGGHMKQAAQATARRLGVTPMGAPGEQQDQHVKDREQALADNEARLTSAHPELEDAMNQSDFSGLEDYHQPDEGILDPYGIPAVEGSDDEQDQWRFGGSGSDPLMSADGRREREAAVAEWPGADKPLTGIKGEVGDEFLPPIVDVADEQARQNAIYTRNIGGGGGGQGGGGTGGGVGAGGPAGPAGPGGGNTGGAAATIDNANVNQANADNVTGSGGPTITNATTTPAGGSPPVAPPTSAATTTGGNVTQSFNTATQSISNARLDATDTAMAKPNAAQVEFDQKGFFNKFLRGAVSGGWGAMEATGALKGIPGIGQISQVISGIVDETIQAPIRAQLMWRQAQARGSGGFGVMARWNNKNRVQALGFLKEEENIMAGGTQHRALQENGHLLSGWDNSMDSARQVAARAIADYEGRRRVTESRDVSGEKRGALDVSDYFRANMLSSMQNPLNVKQMNFSMKEGTLNIDEYNRSRRDDGKGGFIENYTFAGTRKGFDGLLRMQETAALENAAAVPLDMKNVYAVHARKMWDRTDDIKNAKPGSIFYGKNTGQAFLIDEHHMFKNEFKQAGEGQMALRNYRQKADIFINQKVSDSKQRDYRMSQAGIEMWKEDQFGKMLGQVVQTANTKNNFERTMRVRSGKSYVNLLNGVEMLGAKLMGEGKYVADVQMALGQLVVNAGDDLLKSVKATDRDTIAKQVISLKDLQKMQGIKPDIAEAIQRIAAKDSADPSKIYIDPETKEKYLIMHSVETDEKKLAKS